VGLTHCSTGLGVMKEMFQVRVNSPNDLVVALGGNPNTGKSTVFNSLTGLNQHTGNWPGKTVTNARGKYTHKGDNFILVDLPGTYSLLANSAEEEVARNFICFGRPDATVIVTDATCLERNLYIVLQVIEITDNVVVCVNLLDEAEKKKIRVDLPRLSTLLGVPVIGTNARSGIGLKELKDVVYKVATNELKVNPVRICYDEVVEGAVRLLEPHIEEKVKNKLNSRWVALRLLEGEDTILDSLRDYLGVDIREDDAVSSALSEAKQYLRQKQVGKDELCDRLAAGIVKLAEDIREKTVVFENGQYKQWERKIDNILTSKVFGIPIMLALLGVVFWLTIEGANYPSQVLNTILFWVEDRLTDLCMWAGLPDWLRGAVVMGMYRTLAWVVSVMLPPMAIFFPLLTLLEDSGYLPRIAFNLDNFFKKVCAHGKQALTMCMGFGCNAAGVIACRIIDSPRERLIAAITNNFVPCNGRFPTLIALAVMFVAGSAGKYRSILASLFILGVIVSGVAITLFISSILSRTILRGLPSSFTLELPPYRKPQIGRIIIRSIHDRTLFVLARAMMVAAPAGLLIWLLANLQVGSTSILRHCALFLDPFARWIGLDGYILLAFILGFPANEIVIPVVIMSYTATGYMIELDSLEALRELLVANGWTWLTGVCAMLFCLNHFPCGTTMLTIYKETQSMKWSLVAFFVPVITGIVLCFVVAQAARLLGLMC